MAPGMDLDELPDGDLGVNRGRLQRFMPEQLLDALASICQRAVARKIVSAGEIHALRFIGLHRQPQDRTRSVWSFPR